MSPSVAVPSHCLLSASHTVLVPKHRLRHAADEACRELEHGWIDRLAYTQVQVLVQVFQDLPPRITTRGAILEPTPQNTLRSIKMRCAILQGTCSSTTDVQLWKRITANFMRILGKKNRTSIRMSQALCFNSAQTCIVCFAVGNSEEILTRGCQNCQILETLEACSTV